MDDLIKMSPSYLKSEIRIKKQEWIGLRKLEKELFGGERKEEEIKNKIDKGIPMPEHSKRGTKRGNKNRHPFKYMEVGDSYLYHNEKCETQYRCAANAARNWAQQQKKDWKFSVRYVAEGVRVWRIE